MSADSAYYKLYMGGDLVASVFVRGESGLYHPFGTNTTTATVALPAGTYQIKVAYGTSWFGPDDMFGDYGDYRICTFDGSDTVDFQANHWYEITSSSTDDEGQSVSNKSTDRQSF